MRVTIEEIAGDEEEQLILKCHMVSPEMLALIQKIKNADNGITGISGDEIHRLSFQDIYYFEVVDNKSFCYCEKEVYESKCKLYEFEEMSVGNNFFRASKSVVLNADKIDYIRPSFSGRFEAVLLNREKVIVSRQYVNELKKIMGV